MANWLEADTHYLHPNIIIYCKRPYIRLDAGDITSEGKWSGKDRGRTRALEMTEDMIGWHNELVKPEDTVWHLGDFTFGGAQDAARLLLRLNGNYKFIWGNHDKALKDFSEIVDRYPAIKDRVEFLGNMAEVNIEGQPVTLCHYALRTWHSSHRGAWSLYGHSHGTLPDDPNSLSFDVGVDCHNYRPVSFDRAKEIMRSKKFKPVDHHGSR